MNLKQYCIIYIWRTKRKINDKLKYVPIYMFEAHKCTKIFLKKLGTIVS